MGLTQLSTGKEVRFSKEIRVKLMGNEMFCNFCIFQPILYAKKCSNTLTKNKLSEEEWKMTLEFYKIISENMVRFLKIQL